METWTWELKECGPTPQVSIIVCAYSKSAVTMDCLAALHEAQAYNSTRAEIILVDDASLDDTLRLVAGVRGLRVIALEQNVGFTRAANAGLAAARGEHILFLNNDTLPVGRWLDPLVETLRRRPRALCVGSRLVFPDGVLQEAGGIMFSDGSGWNYGRGMDAFDPRVTFERQVDYVSGASLLCQGDFVRSRGGFDERYAPAYYEDVDLCFAARAEGGEVWYQPSSIVVHDEGQSHGTDTSSGIKAHQERNRVTFVERWSQALRSHFPPAADVVPRARQRAERGRILVIDNEIPTPDRDAGSVRLVAILQVMLDLGHAVTFLPLNGWRREPYTRRLESMGVEVLGVPDRWWSALLEMRDGISHVWISRPHVAEAVLDRVRAGFPEATVLYDSVDLHFLRIQRQAETLNDPAVHREALQTQVREIGVIERSDVAIVVSSFEKEILEDRVTTPVVLVPTVHTDAAGQIWPSGRSGILFVGGFQHLPNVDAVVWFVHEVLPLVLGSQPDVLLTIVGANPPPEVQALTGEHVALAGWVPDLLSYYESARVAIAPLRFGAGVKGKVGESMSMGVPMVITRVAAEGMHIHPGEHAMVDDEPQGFAAAICSLLSDDALWTRMSLSGRQHIHDRFGIEQTRIMVASALDAAPRRELTWA